MSERNEQIYRQRKDGITLQELSKKYGVCKERIRQICEKEEERKLPPMFEIELLFPDRKENPMAVRAIKCLKRGKIVTIDSLSHMTDEELLRIRNLGVATLNLIRNRLQRWGNE